MQLQGLNEDRLFWVDYDEKTSVLLKHIDKPMLRKLLKQATSEKFVNHKKTEDFDATKADILLGQAVIKDWKGVMFGDDPAPCSPENIALLMTKHNKFCEFINGICVDIDALIEQEKESAAKNL